MNVLEDEWYAVRHSGEIPEVALNSAFYYLSHDADGPGLNLSREQVRMLAEAARMRYQEIVLRDLQQSNRETPAYRGVKRSVINWQRYRIFCRRQGLDPDEFRPEVAAGFLRFVEQEVADVERGVRESSINCNYDEICSFATELGLALSRLPASLGRICCPEKT